MERGDFSASYCHLSTLKALSGLCSALLYLFLPFFFPLCGSFVLVFGFVARSQLAQAFQLLA